MVHSLEAELDQHRRHTPERGAKALTVQNHKEKDAYLQYEVRLSVQLYSVCAGNQPGMDFVNITLTSLLKGIRPSQAFFW